MLAPPPWKTLKSLFCVLEYGVQCHIILRGLVCCDYWHTYWEFHIYRASRLSVPSYALVCVRCKVYGIR